MKRQFFLRTVLVLGMIISGILSAAVMAKADDKPYLPPSLIKIETDRMFEFGKMFNVYVSADCDSVANQARPDGQKLKRCLTITKELYEKFTGFHQAIITFPDKVKNAGKWTKELDEDFTENAAKRGVDSNLVQYVKQNGGLRDFYQKNINTVSQLKGELAAEVKKLENLQEKSASIQNRFDEPMFANVSFKRSSTPASARLSCKSLAVRMVVAYVGFGIWGTAGTGSSGAGSIICGWLA